MLVVDVVQRCHSWVGQLVSLLAWKISQRLLVIRNLVLRSDAFRSEPTQVLWVLWPKHMVSSAITFHLWEANKARTPLKRWDFILFLLHVRDDWHLPGMRKLVGAWLPEHPRSWLPRKRERVGELEDQQALLLESGGIRYREESFTVKMGNLELIETCGLSLRKRT